MRGQVSIEFLLNTAIWLAFIFIIITGLLFIAKDLSGSDLSKTANANMIARELEGIQSTGFTAYVKVNKHKLIGNLIALDEDAGKTVTAETTYAMEDIDGQPQ
jgi:uncharacterized protein (UPF0333 family)